MSFGDMLKFISTRSDSGPDATRTEVSLNGSVSCVSVTTL